MVTQTPLPHGSPCSLCLQEQDAGGEDQQADGAGVGVVGAGAAGGAASGLAVGAAAGRTGDDGGGLGGGGPVVGESLVGVRAKPIMLAKFLGIPPSYCPPCLSLSLSLSLSRRLTSH